MKPAESIAELEKQMTAKISNTMRLTVAEHVKDKLVKSAAENVSGSSSRSSGGISDPTSMVAEVETAGNSIVLTVSDEALPQDSVFGTPFSPSSPTQFAEWIEEGQWMDLMDFIMTGEKTKRPPRPFVQPVQEELNANPKEIENMIRKALE